jgi:hypothetical protein
MRQASARFRGWSVSACPADRRTENGGFTAVTDAGRVDVGVEIRFEIMMHRHFVALAAFFMQTEPPPFAPGTIVLDAHGDDGADAGKGESHRRNHRSIEQPDHG